MELGIILSYGEGTIKGFIAKYSGKSFNVKGILRISWDLNLKYNKMINIILFLDKSCEEVIDASFEGNSALLGGGEARQYAWAITSPYPNDENNYRLTEELLGKEKFKTFFSTRFGCRRIAVQGTVFNFDHTYISEEKNPYDRSRVRFSGTPYIVPSIYLDFNFPDALGMPTVSLKDFKIIDINSIVLAEKEKIASNVSYTANAIESQCYSISGAFVKTSSRDMYVNMRDKPSSKDGKIIRQLIVQDLLYDEPEDLYEGEGDALWSKYQEEIEKYILSHKEMMKPGAYTVFAHDILPDDWCYVTLYSFPGDANYIDEERLLHAKYPKNRNICETMNEAPRTITISKGYIHVSQLTAFSSCRGAVRRRLWEK